MAWPDDPPPAIRHELHFGDRLLRCFAERPRSLYGLLETAVLRDPDGVALIDGGARISYRALAERVQRLAAGLAAQGIRPGDRLALLLANRPEFAVALFAAARLGAIAVPLSVREQTPGLQHMLAQSGAKLLLHEPDLADRLPAPASLPGLRRAALQGEGDDRFAALPDGGALAPAPHRPEEEDVAVILCTSGTTGRPKGAMLTHLNLAHSVVHYALGRGLSRRDRALLAVPASHAIGLVGMLLSMVHVGGSTVLMRAFEARRLLELVAAEHVTVTGLVPAMYHLCLLEPGFADLDLSSWRIAGYGGAPMPETTIAELRRRLPRLQLMNAYGATETTAAATMMPPGQTARHPDSVGRALPCAEVRVIDGAGREVPPGVMGEVWIRGPMVVPGYWANDAATRESFVAGFWRSGDVGRIDAAGYLRIDDRLKDMINRAGYKVFSIEVEQALGEHPEIVEAAVVARPDPVLGERVHAFVVTRDGRLTAEEVRAFAALRLADYKVPDSVTVGGEPLPRNPMGKLQKGVLRRRLAERAP
ncbi:MAG TPA: AMP-binding protein [Geminicoccaceae bacterium]|nr:AMP-binding protein [Geminicoccaceae bacterium]